VVIKIQQMAKKINHLVLVTLSPLVLQRKVIFLSGSKQNKRIKFVRNQVKNKELNDKSCLFEIKNVFRPNFLLNF
jgi:hypothetical protein